MLQCLTASIEDYLKYGKSKQNKSVALPSCFEFSFFFSEKEGFPIHNIKRNESDGDATVRRIQCKSSLISLDLEYLSLCGIFSIQNLLGFP